MKIDCSKISNQSDAVALLGIILIFLAIAFAVYLSAFVHTFYGGFVAATITWKWDDWIFKPIDKLLDKLWPEY